MEASRESIQRPAAVNRHLVLTKRKPIVALDARAVQEAGCGVATYSLGLIEHLEILRSDFDFVFVVDGTKDISPAKFPSKSQFIKTAGRGNFWSRDLFDQLVLPLRLSSRHVSLYHGLDYVVPLARTPFAKVATFHDACAFSDLDDRSLLAKGRLRFILRRVAAGADAIVTVSEYSRRELAHFLPGTCGKTTVVWCGMLDEFGAAGVRAADPQVDEISSDSEFILYYGGYSKRKRVELLLQAFQFVRTARSVTLVLAGRIDGAARRSIDQLIADLGLGASVRFFGFATREQLRLLLERCQLFVFPSALEGFGLPAAEAMACGAAVVCSEAGSLPEICGDAAHYFTGADPSRLAAAITDVLGDAALRNRLRARGPVRASAFTWEQHVAELGAIYDRLLSRRR